MTEIEKQQLEQKKKNIELRQAALERRPANLVVREALVEAEQLLSAADLLLRGARLEHERMLLHGSQSREAVQTQLENRDLELKRMSDLQTILDRDEGARIRRMMFGTALAAAAATLLNAGVAIANFMMRSPR